MKEALATVEICVLCGWKFLNHFDIVSETPYSCDTVGCELWQVILCSQLCLKRTGKYALESMVMCLFYSTLLYSTLLCSTLLYSTLLYGIFRRVELNSQS